MQSNGSLEKVYYAVDDIGLGEMLVALNQAKGTIGLLSLIVFTLTKL